MKKDKKFSGYSGFVSNDESLLITMSRNTVYVNSLITKKLLLKTKSVKNIDMVTISPDNSLIAAKSTIGEIALINAKNGEEICMDRMEKSQGELMYFTSDSSRIVDLDWNGKVMLFDCAAKTHSILDDSKILERCAYIQYDPFSNRIYRFMAERFGNSPGIVQVAIPDEKFLDKEHFKYTTAQIFTTHLPSCVPHHPSLCKEHNFWYDVRADKIIVCDKDFKEIDSFKNPPSKSKKEFFSDFWVSPDENYLFIDYGKQCDPGTSNVEYDNIPSLSVLYDLKTLKPLKEFSYDYVSDFTMYNDEKNYVIGTWRGTFVGEVDSTE